MANDKYTHWQNCQIQDRTIIQSEHQKSSRHLSTTKKRGWGLGLSLAKRIIEVYHSGKIFVRKSLDNEGTTFRIKLPKGG